MRNRPHIVMFVPDHYRGDVLGHSGNGAAVSPNLDRIVREEGVSFLNTFCQNPVCTPSRCSFMSGRYPHVRGHRTMAHMLQPDEPVLLQTLKDAGYWVWWGGKNDLVPGQLGPENYCNVLYKPPEKPRTNEDRMPESRWRGEPGDDSYYAFFQGKTELPEGETVFKDADQLNVEGAVDMINEAPEGRPLCIYLPLRFPHLPYGVEEPWFSLIDREALPPRIPTPEDWSLRPSIEKGLAKNYNMASWNEERWRELKAVYYGMCARIDHQAGMVIDALKKRGIWDDTLFMFFSDHGEYAGDYGIIDINQNTFEDTLIKVPLVIKPPKVDPKEQSAVLPGVRRQLVELLDIVATVEDFTGLSLYEDHFSRSLVPLLIEPEAEHRDAVFCEGGRRHGEFQAMELEATKSLRPDGHYWPRLRLERSSDGEHGKAVMVRTPTHKYIRRLYERDELYDLTRDPQETENRIDDPSCADALLQLKERLLTFFLETGDVVPRTPDARSF
jgi:arylsulfatase A-like enzyme